MPAGRASSATRWTRAARSRACCRRAPGRSSRRAHHPADQDHRAGRGPGGRPPAHLQQRPPAGDEPGGPVRDHRGLSRRGASGPATSASASGKRRTSSALQALLDRTYEAMRKLILVAIPEEPQSFEDYVDDDGLGNGPYKMKLTIWRRASTPLRLDGHRSAGSRADQLLPLRGHVQDVHRDLPDHGQRSPDPLQRRLLSAAARRPPRRAPCSSRASRRRSAAARTGSPGSSTCSAAPSASRRPS